jgi:hypothetical protein
VLVQELLERGISENFANIQNTFAMEMVLNFLIGDVARVIVLPRIQVRITYLSDGKTDHRLGYLDFNSNTSYLSVDVKERELFNRDTDISINLNDVKKIEILDQPALIKRILIVLKTERLHRYWRQAIKVLKSLSYEDGMSPDLKRIMAYLEKQKITESKKLKSTSALGESFKHVQNDLRVELAYNRLLDRVKVFITYVKGENIYHDLGTLYFYMTHSTGDSKKLNVEIRGTRNTFVHLSDVLEIRVLKQEDMVKRVLELLKIRRFYKSELEALKSLTFTRGMNPDMQKLVHYLEKHSE